MKNFSKCLVLFILSVSSFQAYGYEIHCALVKRDGNDIVATINKQVTKILLDTNHTAKARFLLEDEIFDKKISLELCLTGEFEKNESKGSKYKMNFNVYEANLVD